MVAAHRRADNACAGEIPPRCSILAAMRIVRHLAITGRVQGVGYRYYLEYKARQFGVTGWVRNRADGSVEAVIQGTADAVEAVIVRARRGPPRAAVAHVTVTDADGDYADDFADFRTLPTA